MRCARHQAHAAPSRVDEECRSSIVVEPAASRPDDAP
jgi:hypothetical protein